MGALRNMPVTGVLVIATIAVLFILAVILLFYVRIRYRFLEGKARGNDPEVRGFRSAVLKEYTAAYKQYGQDVNTPRSLRMWWARGFRGCCCASAS